MERLLADLHVELVFTAHPTEAKRRSVLSKLRRVGQRLHDLEVRDLLPAERRARLIAAIPAEITALWPTERNRTSQPTVTDEVRTGLFYLDNTVWDILPRIYDAMAHALASCYPRPQRRPVSSPSPPGWVAIATAIRSSPAVTRRDAAPAPRPGSRTPSARDPRARPLPEPVGRLRPASETLLAALTEARERRSDTLPALEQRYPNEPYRLFAAVLADDLAAASADDVTGRLLGQVRFQRQ